MAFVVEDGTGLALANSYASTTDFLAYHAERGVVPAFTTTQIEQAMVRATDYLDTRFRFVGTKETNTQALAWPRIVEVLDPDDFEFDPVPLVLKKALYVYSLEALYSSLFPSNLSATPAIAPGTGTSLQAPLRRIKERIGQMELEEEYAVSASFYTGTIRPIPAADHLLRGLVVKTNDVVRA